MIGPGPSHRSMKRPPFEQAVQTADVLSCTQLSQGLSRFSNAWMRPVVRRSLLQNMNGETAKLSIQIDILQPALLRIGGGVHPKGKSPFLSTPPRRRPDHPSAWQYGPCCPGTEPSYTQSNLRQIPIFSMAQLQMEHCAQQLCQLKRLLRAFRIDPYVNQLKSVFSSQPSFLLPNRESPSVKSGPAQMTAALRDQATVLLDLGRGGIVDAHPLPLASDDVLFGECHPLYAPRRV